MALLIDGYNLLHVAGIFGAGRGPGGFQRSRNALLNHLASSLDEDERRSTTIVFDAADAPPGLPRTVDHHGVTVRYAVGYPDADALIEELIRADSAPRRLTVVSSDHRVQRAARRRRAAAVDSERWCEQLIRRTDRAAPPPAKPAAPLSADEVQRWLEEFGGAWDAGLEIEALNIDADPAAPADITTTPPSPKPGEPEVDDLANPFPPGYADDLLSEED